MKYTIKPLEWRDQSNGTSMVDTLLGRYFITKLDGSYELIFYPKDGFNTSIRPLFLSLEAAKAAAEADWQARIKEALEPVPSGWISVKDRLPEDWDNTLVTNGEFVRRGYCYSGVWFASSDYSKFESEEITHWQPMPEPPMEEQE